MWNVRGRGGILFAVSDPAPLSVRLEDDGDGFTWRAADVTRSLWEGSMGFQAHFEGAWSPLAPLSVDADAGRVVFPRCLRGQSLQATGNVRPISVLSELEDWALHATPGCPFEGMFGEVGEPAELMLARLPFADGFYVGLCKPGAGLNPGLHVTFMEGAPHHVRNTNPP